MRSKVFLFVGIFLIIVGLVMMGLYCAADKTLLSSFDEVTQIENARINTFEDYKAWGNFELSLIIVSILSSIYGAILFLKHKKSFGKNI